MRSHLTLDLASSTSTSMSLTLFVLLLFDLEPLRQSSADLKIEKEIFLLSTSMSLHSLHLSLRISVLRVDYDIFNIRVPYLLLWWIYTSGVKDGGHGFESRWSSDFFGLFLSNCLNWKITAMIILNFQKL